MMKLAMPLVTVMISGCANSYPPSRVAVLKPNTTYWISYDATRRGAWMSTDTADHSVSSCAEPAPDVALSLATTLKAKASTPGNVSAEGEFSATAAALALVGRDNVVLLPREALFRICEAAASGKIESKDVKPLFEKIIDQTQAIAVEQARKSRAATVDAAIKALPTADPVAAKALSEFIRTP